VESESDENLNSHKGKNFQHQKTDTTFVSISIFP